GRYELPIVAGSMQLELQHTKDAYAAHLTVRLDRAKPVQLCATYADHKLAYALRVGNTIDSLRGEALVDMIVPVQHHIGTGARQDIPDRSHMRIVAVDAAG